MDTSLTCRLQTKPQQLLFYRELLLKKLSYAITSSVLSQFLILLFYLLVIKFDFLHPLNWIILTLTALASFSTWIFIILFLCVIFAQCLLCAKDYIFTPVYCATRMTKFVSIFSIRNGLLLMLNILGGCFGVWLLLSQTTGDYSSLIVSCEGKSCVSEGTFYILCAGIWHGFCYFLKIYNGDNRIAFPVLHQPKLLRFKVRLIGLIKESYYAVIVPYLSFIVLYYIWGSAIAGKFASIAMMQTAHSESSSWEQYFYVYLYGGWFYFNMNLMRYYFELFLTEPIQLSTCEDNRGFTLGEAIAIDTIPIIQHLATLDLYNLIDDPERRSALMMLSQPGGHPHNWDKICSNSLILLNKFTDRLNVCTLPYATPAEITQLSFQTPTRPTHPQSPLFSPIQQPSCMVKTPIYSPMRNMSVRYTNCSSPLNITYQQCYEVQCPPSAPSHLLQRLQRFICDFKERSGFKYFFGELPEANLQCCLSDGQTVIWCAEGLAYLVAVSICEDRYGIVQKDLAAILTSMVQLKTAVDRLNRIPALSSGKAHRNGDYNYKMKISINNAVRRSLYKICHAFGGYLKDIPIKRETAAFLQPYMTK